MAYFDPTFLTFLGELADNNNREWFNENKKTYTRYVKEPFEQFIGDMLDRTQDIILGTDGLAPKDCIFRIYRDVRFSKDKSPYKTHVSAIITSGGRKNMTSPGMYLQFSAEDARMYSGLYQLDKHQLLKVREAIAQDMDGFATLVSGKAFVKEFGEIQGEKHKRLASPFKELSEQQPLLFHKSFYYFKTFPADTVLREDFPDLLMKSYAACRPVSEFFNDALSA